MQYLLVIFGWAALLTSVSLILVPYLRGRSDLLNSWTIFHFGACNFLGIASIGSGTALTHLYNAPVDEDYQKFVLGGLVFYVVLILTYYFLPLGRLVARHTWVKVGRRTPRVMIMLVPVCILLTLGYLYVPQVQFVGQWMVTIGRSASVFAVAFCLTAWAQRPRNLWLVALAVLIIGFTSVAVNTELGRRDFLSVLITIPLCWYWFRARYYRPGRVLFVAGVFAVIAFVGITGVSLTRFIKHSPDASIIEIAWEKLKAAPDALMNSGTNGEQIIGSDCVDASLAAIRLYDHVKPTEPFFILEYIMVHPMPRAWWPDKPKGLGYSLPYDIGWVRYHGDVSIGPGIVGHGYHEGGLFFIGFYAFLFASFMRFFDTLLARDPGNPYLIGILGAASGHLIGLLRGDVGLFAALMLGGFAAGVLVNWLSRLLFGSDHLEAGVPLMPAPTDEYQYGLDYPGGMTA